MKSTYHQWKEGTYTFPGGFELSIFKAYDVADEGNQDRLRHAFPYYFDDTWTPPKEKPKTVMYQGREVEVEDCTPSWLSIARIHLNVLENEKASEKGKRSAWAEMEKMAKIADQFVEAIPFLNKYNYKP